MVELKKENIYILEKQHKNICWIYNSPIKFLFDLEKSFRLLVLPFPHSES